MIIRLAINLRLCQLKKSSQTILFGKNKHVHHHKQYMNKYEKA